jgi:hypothetical protein
MGCALAAVRMQRAIVRGLALRPGQRARAAPKRCDPAAATGRCGAAGAADSRTAATARATATTRAAATARATAPGWRSACAGSRSGTSAPTRSRCAAARRASTRSRFAAARRASTRSRFAAARRASTGSRLATGSHASQSRGLATRSSTSPSNSRAAVITAARRRGAGRAGATGRASRGSRSGATVARAGSLELVAAAGHHEDRRKSKSQPSHSPMSLPSNARECMPESANAPASRIRWRPRNLPHTANRGFFRPRDGR